MKKLVALLLAAGMILVAFAGCTKENPNTSGTSGTDDKVKIVLLINGTLGDKSFFD